MSIRIDPEFKALIPLLSKDERIGLEAKLLSDGCRDSLVIWDGHNILLDGHNRLEICQRNGIPFDTHFVDLRDRDAAMDWIDTNQLGRRNLIPPVMSLLRDKLYHKTKKSLGGDGSSEDVSRDQNDPLKQQNLWPLNTACRPQSVFWLTHTFHSGGHPACRQQSGRVPCRA